MVEDPLCYDQDWSPTFIEDHKDSMWKEFFIGSRRVGIFLLLIDPKRIADTLCLV